MRQASNGSSRQAAWHSKAKVRRLTRNAILLAIALVLALVERWIPLHLVIPVPGLKLGLANVVTLFALLCVGRTDALLILVVRSAIMGAILGPMTFVLSFSGGLLAFLMMWLASLGEGRIFSVIGLSVLGAAAHNTGQVFMASLVLSEPLLLTMYLPPLLLTGLGTGTLTGVAALPVIRRFRMK